MVTDEDANTKPSERESTSEQQSLDALCGYHETPQAVRRMAATAEVQHSFREACMRYVGGTRGRRPPGQWKAL